MDLLAAFGVFLACVVGCMGKGASLGWALAAGFVCFFAVGAAVSWSIWVDAFSMRVITSPKPRIREAIRSG